MNKLSAIFIIIVLTVFVIAPIGADAINLNLNVKYPRLPVPGGSFDLNKAIEKQNLSGEQVISLGTLIIFVFIASIWVSGFILLGSLIYTGIIYITSGASPGRRAKALERVNNVIWGIGILLFAYIIVFIISPDIVKLKLTGQDNVIPGTAENYPDAGNDPDAWEETPLVSCTGENGNYVQNALVVGDATTLRDIAEFICSDTGTVPSKQYAADQIINRLSLSYSDASTRCTESDAEEVVRIVNEETSCAGNTSGNEAITSEDVPIAVCSVKDASGALIYDGRLLKSIEGRIAYDSGDEAALKDYINQQMYGGSLGGVGLIQECKSGVSNDGGPLDYCELRDGRIIANLNQTDQNALLDVCFKMIPPYAYGTP